MSFILKGKKARRRWLRQVAENLVAAQDEAAIVGGDSVDDDFGALRHFDGLAREYSALVIFSVDSRPTIALRVGGSGTVFQKLIFAGAIDGVARSGAATIRRR